MNRTRRLQALRDRAEGSIAPKKNDKLKEEMVDEIVTTVEDFCDEKGVKIPIQKIRKVLKTVIKDSWVS